MLKRLFILSLMLGVMMSCQRDKIDFDKLKDISISPGLKVPLVNAKLKLADLLVNDSTLIEDPDGGLRVKFIQDSLFGFAAIDFVSIPPQSPTTMPLIYDTAGVPLDIDLALGTMGGVSMESAIFHKGFFVYEITTQTPVSSDTDIRLKIKNATLNGVVFDNLLTLPANATSIKDSLDIAGLEFDLSNGGTATNYFGFYIDIENAPGAPQFHQYDLSINFAGLELDQATGDFGQRVINIPNGSFDFDISAFEKFAQGVYLTDPSIKLFIHNSMGIKVGINPDFLGVNSKGLITDLGIGGLLIDGPTTPGGTESTTITIDRNNSQIVPFLASLPNLISYGGQGQLNPNGNTLNFIDRNSRLDVGLEVDIPLALRAEDVILEQIVEIGSIADSGQSDMLKSLDIYFRSINGFPFDVNMTVAFLDSVSGDSIAGVSLNLLNAAPVDAQGRVTSKVTSDDKMVFGQDEIDGLLRSDRIKIRAVINTSQGGQKDVKLFTDYELEVKLAVDTQVNISLTQ